MLETGILIDAQATGFTHGCTCCRILKTGILIDLHRLQDSPITVRATGCPILIDLFRLQHTHRLAQITRFTHRCACYGMLETGIFIDLHRSQDSLIVVRVTGCSEQ
jgi:hypothetical protein